MNPLINFFIVLRDILKFEKDRVYSLRLKKQYSLRPSSVIVLIFALFYHFSSVDLVPEGILNTSLAFADDIIIYILAATYILLDITYTTPLTPELKLAMKVEEVDEEELEELPVLFTKKEGEEQDVGEDAFE